MPELPEVETTRRGISPYLKGNLIDRIIVRQPVLRWPIPDQVQALRRVFVSDVVRRAKYLLVETSAGTILIHLGMSGSLRVVRSGAPAEKHDHVDFIINPDCIIRFRDPRRFGAVLFTDSKQQHPLLLHLGPEPLSDDFHAAYLYEKARNRSVNIKTFVMNAQIVVGVGNIYANEALFMARIDPRRRAGEISFSAFERLVKSIKIILQQAIQQGGTTLKDFVREDGQTGYFQVELKVYGRGNEPCVTCQAPLQHIRQGQRSTWFCPQCQH